jgi:hypothetical protein
LLDQPVCDGWDTQRAGTTRRFGEFHPFNRQGLIVTICQRFTDRFPVVTGKTWKRLYRYIIDTGLPLLAFTRFHADCMFSRDNIRSSRQSFGVGVSITRRICAPPVGFFVLCELIEAPSRFKCLALHHVPGITPGIGLLWPLLTSARSPSMLPCRARPDGCMSGRSPRIRT